MRAFLIVAFLVVTGAVVWYFATGHEKLDLGVSGDRPLGDAALLEAHLAGKGLEKGGVHPDELRTLFGERFPDPAALSSTEYADSVAGMKHRVVLVREASGRLVGVAARFRSGAKDFSLTGTKCEHFAGVYWLELAGGRPDWRKLDAGGADAAEYWLATTDRRGVTCTWKKEGSGGPTLMTHEIHDTVAFAVR